MLGHPSPSPRHQTSGPLPLLSASHPLLPSLALFSLTPIPSPQTSHLGTSPHSYYPPLLVTSGGDHWRPVQICSSRDLTTPSSSNIWWWQLKLKRVQLPSGRYASYWKAVLFFLCKLISNFVEHCISV